MKNRWGVVCTRLAFQSVLLFAVGAGAGFSQTNVLTWHNDNARTGQNLTETILTPANVTYATFGKLYTVPVDGKVDAQPLYVSGLTIAGQSSKNVVFAATENDSVYAFDADSGTVYWQVSLVGAGETASDNRDCGQVTPTIGVIGTPVIDLSAGPNGTIFLVAMSKNATGTYFQRLHALDITTGAEMSGSPTLIQPSYTGQGDVTWDPSQVKSRPGLLLLNGIVYTSWGGHCDTPPYTGWTVGFNESTLQQTNVFNFVPNGTMGSIWGSGSGPAADEQGNLYFSVANGTFDILPNAAGFPRLGNFGNSFVKLSLQKGVLAATDYWAMYNVISEVSGDVDLGSGGIMLLPDQTDATNTVRHLAVGAGKDSNLYVVDRDNMGKFDRAGDATIYQQLTGALPGGIWSSPAYYNGFVYFGARGDYIRAFQVDSALLSASPVSMTQNEFVYPGATPSISANGASGAILWAVENSNPAYPAILYAYDATNLTTELYDSNQAPLGRDQFGPGNKFIVPTIANGKVFVGTNNSVAVFGLLPPVTVPNAVGLAQADATTLLSSLGLLVGPVSFLNSETAPAGQVITETPAAGTVLVWGSVISLVISLGPLPPGAAFNDIPASATYFDAANLMFAAGVTTGCIEGSTPDTRSFCPSDNVTRQEMAAFVVRAITGTTTPTIYNPTPYFEDVPATNLFFPHIQKLADLGITSGCGVGQFCPTDPIPRWEMAIFMVRARLALYGASFTFNSTPYFADVPTNVESNGMPFPFIQRSYEENITAGCGTNPLIYCPDGLVTRGQMASFIMRGLFNETTILGPTAPQVTGVSPNTMDATVGAQITVTITGTNTNFQTGDTVTVPSGMLAVSSITVNSTTSITATLTANANVVAGPQALVVTSGGQNLTLPLALQVGTY
jgi:hypothetical protein